MSSDTAIGQKTIRSRWLRYWKNPKDKGYMNELPPEDYELNTVTTVNPYIYLDEIEEVKKEQAYQERVESALKRREQHAKAQKKREKIFIKQVNSRSGAPWYQDLSTRQGKGPKSKISYNPCCRKIYRSSELAMFHKRDEEERERKKVIKGNLERLTQQVPSPKIAKLDRASNKKK